MLHEKVKQLLFEMNDDSANSNCLIQPLIKKTMQYASEQLLFEMNDDSANSYCLIQPLVKENAELPKRRRANMNDETRLRTKKHGSLPKRTRVLLC